MSSPTPPPPPPTPVTRGECVVCGEMTTKRCSSCASHGTDWMFFCSQSHQKLVWSVHKRVCGQRSNPYHWPALSSREIDEMLETCDRPFAPVEVNGREVRTWLDIHTSRDDPLESRLDSMRKVLKTAQEPSNDQTLPLSKTRRIAVLRAQAYKTSVDSEDHLHGGRIQPHNVSLASMRRPPFNMLAHVQSYCDEDLPVDPHFAPWWTMYQHKHLMHVALVTEFAKNPFSNEIWDCVWWTKTELVRFCAQVIKETHPELAENIVEGLIEMPRGFGMSGGSRRKDCVGNKLSDR